MSNDLVRMNWSGGNGRTVDTDVAEPHDPEAQTWDLPPEEMGYGPRRDPHPVHDARTKAGARQADSDADRAAARGDGTFQAIRKSDAADLRQKRWDWGDARTWLWIGAMCAVFLLFVALCYFLPYGRHASPPAIRVY